MNPGTALLQPTSWRRARAEQPSPDLVEHLRSAAGRYFDDFGGGPAEVVLADSIRTKNADIHRFALRSAGRDREVIVKSRRIRPDGANAGAGPESVLPSVPDRLKIRHEMRALETIEAHFRALARPGLGAVRPLEVVVPDRAFVMEAAPGENLLRTLDRLPRRADPPEASRASLRHCGAWLREYHGLAALDQSEPQSDSRDGFLEWLRELAGICEALEIGRIEGLFPRVESAARRALPSQLPRGLGHGDFHAGNIVADATGCVRVIDTFAAWSGPVYYDLSQFLYDLKAPTSRMYEQGLRAAPAYVAVAEREFLRGYFGLDERGSELAAIRLFEIQWLLYRWARTARAAERPGAIGHAKRLRLGLKSRFVASLLAELLRDFETCTARD